MTARELEAEAVRSHKAGEPWASFWARVGDEVRRAEPHDRQRWRRLYHRLFALHTAGDLDGRYPPGDPTPWETDDQADGLGEVSDTQTRACLQGTLFDTSTPYA